MLPTHFVLLSWFAREELNDLGVRNINAALVGLTDWDSFFALSQAHSMVPLMFRHIRKYGIVIPSSKKRQLTAMMIEHTAFANARYKVMEELGHHFDVAKIQYIPLKGIVLAPMLYESEQLRPMRDIDLLMTKADCYQAANILRGLGYEIADKQSNRWEEGLQHLPEARKQVNGFTISIELHHDAIHRDAKSSLTFSEVCQGLQEVQYRDLSLSALPHFDMLNQLCRHIQGPDGERLIKLINMLDIVLYAERFKDQIIWKDLKKAHPQVLNTLCCLDLVIPLSLQLKSLVGVDKSQDRVKISDVGQPMGSFRYVFARDDWSFLKKVRKLFAPSEWWLHLYYGVNPCDSLVLVKFFHHPLRVFIMLLERMTAVLKSFQR